jgi:hypothetical protein
MLRYPSYSIVRELVLSRTPIEGSTRQDPRSWKDLVELIGIEPTTSSLQSWRSTN